jgi:hypothetical protein
VSLLIIKLRLDLPPGRVITIDRARVASGNNGVSIQFDKNNRWQGFVDGLYTEEMVQDPEQFLGQFFAQITDFA